MSHRSSSVVVLSGGGIVQSSDHLSVNAHAFVCGFEGLLDLGEIGRSVLSNLHVVSNDLSGSGVTLGNHRKNGEGKDGSFGFRLLAVGFSVRLVGISESSLDKRDEHQLFDGFLLSSCGSTFTPVDLLETTSEVLEDVNVDLGCSSDRIRQVSAGLKVLASLISQGVSKVSRSRSVTSLEGSSVKCNGLVPSVDGVIVTVFDGAGFLAIIKGVFHLTDDVHPDVHVSGSLLDDLFPSFESVKSKVVVEVSELSGLSREGGQNNLVGIVVFSIVVVESFVCFVRAVGALCHLTLGAGGEALDGSFGNVVGLWVVAVADRLSANGQRTSGGEASVEFGVRVGTNLASNVSLLAIGSLVLDENGSGSSGVVFVRLSRDSCAIGINSGDDCSLFGISRKRGGQSYSSNILGEGSFLVNCQCSGESLVVLKGQLNLKGVLVQIDGSLSTKRMAKMSDFETDSQHDFGFSNVHDTAEDKK